MVDSRYQAGSPGLRLAELVGALSLAVDLGLGQPMEHLARSCLLACRLAERMGLGDEDRGAVYYVAMMGWVGCIADSHDAATSFGDDIEYRAGVYDIDMKPLPFLGYLLRRAGSGGPPVRRAGAAAAVLATGARGVQDSLRAHCQVTAAIAERLGMSGDVCDALHQIFARWDGKGLPKGLGGDRVALPVRLWQVGDVADVHFRRAGWTAAVDVVRERSGTQFDPAIVELFCRHGEDLVHGAEAGSAWEELLRTEPGLRIALRDEQVDEVLEVFADYADLKSPYLRGHSRGVADLAAAAGRRLGMDAAQVRTLRRAALVHDLGRVGIPNTIWDRAGSLSGADLERVRLVPYYTERILARPAALREVAAVAALAYERLDGSGYHRALPAAAIDLPARVLAAADCYHAMREPRPHREPLPGVEAARVLHAESEAGRLDPAAVDAVLASAGHPPARPPTGPAGLTPREIQVLELLARGASNRQIARLLKITPKTVSNHVEHVYTKAGVNTRAVAALFAMRHGLLRSLKPIE